MTESTGIHQYVKQETTKKSIIGRIAALIIMASLLAVLSQLEVLRDYMLIIALGIVFIFSAVMKNFNSEYDYFLNGNDFYIDRIYGVTKHKELFSFSLSDITGISEEIIPENGENILNFSSSVSEFSPVLVKLRDERSVILSLNNELKNALSGRVSE